MSYAQRLARADELIADPTPLVTQFTAGIAAFGSYDNPEGFYSNPHQLLHLDTDALLGEVGADPRCDLLSSAVLTRCCD